MGFLSWKTYGRIAISSIAHHNRMERESKMEQVKIMGEKGKQVAICNSDIRIETEQDALDLLSSVQYHYQTNLLI